MPLAVRARPEALPTKPRPVLWRKAKAYFGLKVREEQVKREREAERLTMLALAEEYGKKDEKGSFWVDLEQPFELTQTDGKGNTRTSKIVGFKSQAVHIPAVTTIDPTKAETVLKRRKLWLTKEQQTELRKLQSQLPYAKIFVEIDTSAVMNAYFAKTFSEKEFESMLVETRTVFQVLPVEGQ